MARKAGSDGERTEAAIRDAAVRLIARHGYEAVSMRQLAGEVGVQAAALYRYFPTKEDLLHALLHRHMDGLLQSWETAQPPTRDPVRRLAAFVENHIGFHIVRRHSTHISNMELRSLSPAKLTEILKLRTAYEKQLRTILREGAENGAFAIDDVGLTAMAIIQMITGVIVWFRPDERLSIDDVAAKYLTMTMRLVGVQQIRENGHVRPHAEIRA